MLTLCHDRLRSLFSICEMMALYLSGLLGGKHKVWDPDGVHNSLPVVVNGTDEKNTTALRVPR